MKTFEELKAEFLAMGSISEEVAENLAREALGEYKAPAWMESLEDDRPGRGKPGAGGNKPTIRSLIEQDFLDGGRKCKLDAMMIEDEHDIVLTPQNIKSALRLHIKPGERLSIMRDDEGYFSVAIVTKAAESNRPPTTAVLEDRDRVCRLLMRFMEPGPQREMLMVIVRNGGE